MTFAQEIISDAAALMLVDEENVSLPASEFQVMTRFLNDYCAELFDLGIDFGYRPVVSSSDPITSPTSVNGALKYNLARRAASVFGTPLSAEVALEARATEKRLKANFMRRPKARLPSNLPMGSGHLTRTHSSATFYPFTLPEAFLRLNTTSTVTIATINTPVQVGGWTVDRAVNVDALAAGSVEFTSDGPFLALFEASFTINAASGDQFTFYFAKNGALLEQSALVFDADKAQNIFPRWSETLRRGDIITILVENNSATTDLVLTNGHFRVT